MLLQMHEHCACDEIHPLGITELLCVLTSAVHRCRCKYPMKFELTRLPFLEKLEIRERSPNIFANLS